MPEGARAVPLYEQDYYAWALDQAARLRDRARRSPDLGLDLENLAEEVEGLGTSERSAVLSHVSRVIEHFLKLQHSPSERPRAGWEKSILESRLQLERHLTPTLRRIAADELATEYRRA